MNGHGSIQFQASSAGARRAGFTLLELIAVIAIMAVVSVMMSSGAMYAKRLAEEGACRGNLRVWGAAFHAYAVDHNGLFPHTDDGTRADKSGLSGAESPHKFSYVDMLPPYFGGQAWSNYPSGQKPRRAPWQCPSARLRPDKEYSYTPSRDGYRSYAMNSYLSHDFDYGLGNREKQGSYLNTIKCAAPTRTILMFEQSVDPKDNTSFGKFGERDAGRHSAQDVSMLSVRHYRILGTEGCNLLFIDGHVEWRNNVWANQYSNGRVPATDDLEWYPYRY